MIFYKNDIFQALKVEDAIPIKHWFCNAFECVVTLRGPMSNHVIKPSIFHDCQYRNIVLWITVDGFEVFLPIPPIDAALSNVEDEK